ncbi:hypothetical protein MMPV_000529 [Pyropia vietnamensis]
MTSRVGDYLLFDTLGQGSFAKVKLAVHEATGEECAIKVMDKSKIHASAMTLHVRREIAIMKTLKHPYVIQLHAVLNSSSKLYLVMDLVKGGELFHKIVREGYLSEAEGRKHFQQLVDGVSYCHSMDVCHRDLKPENVLLDAETGAIKIADFGLSALCGATAGDLLLHTQCGSPNYCAPEILVAASTQQGYNGFAVDVWSCGVILYAMLAGRLPFHNLDTKLLYQSISEAPVQFPPNFPAGADDLIRRLLTKDPNRRITFDEVRTHPWFEVDYEPVVIPKRTRRRQTPSSLRTPGGGSTNGSVSSPAVPSDGLSSEDDDYKRVVGATKAPVAATPAPASPSAPVKAKANGPSPGPGVPKRERPAPDEKNPIAAPSGLARSGPSMRTVRAISEDARLLVRHLNDVSVSVEPAAAAAAAAAAASGSASGSTSPGLPVSSDQSDGEEEDVELVQTDGLELYDEASAEFAVEDTANGIDRAGSAADSQLVHAGDSYSTSLRSDSAPQLPMARMGSGDVGDDAYAAGTSLESGLKGPSTPASPASPRDQLRSKHSAGSSSDGRAPKSSRSHDGQDFRRGDGRQEGAAALSGRERDRRRRDRRSADPSRPHLADSFPPPPRGSRPSTSVDGFVSGPASTRHGSSSGSRSVDGAVTAVPPASGRRGARRAPGRAPPDHVAADPDSARGRRGLLNILGLSSGVGGVTSFRWPAPAEQSLLQVARVLSQRLGYPVLVKRSENKVKCAVQIADQTVMLSILATQADGESTVVIRRARRDRSQVADADVEAFAARVYDMFLRMNRESRRGGGAGGGGGGSGSGSGSTSGGRRARGTAMA